MTRHFHDCRAACLGVLVLLAVGLLPAPARSQPRVETLAFRNDTKSAIIVQCAYMVQGKVQRDRPNLLQPTEACRIVLPGNKLITIYNAQMPNQVLFQTTIPAGPEDLYFTVRFDPVQNKVIIERVKPPPR